MLVFQLIGGLVLDKKGYPYSISSPPKLIIKKCCITLLIPYETSRFVAWVTLPNELPVPVKKRDSKGP